MSNKEHSSSSSGTAAKEKETDRKQYGKAGTKGTTTQLKPDNKAQQQKAQPGAKRGNTECAEMTEEDDDEECESSFEQSRSH